MGESVMKQISVLLFTALVSVGVAYAVEVVASAESPQTCMDMASCADSATVITLGKDAGAVGLVYSGYNWWLDNSPSSVSLTDNDEAISTVSGEGIYEWTPDFVGTHTVKHIVGGVTLARTFKAEGPVLTISRGGNGGTICEIASSIGDGTIFFTTDGTEPTEESRVYTGPFAINPSVLTSVKAFCKVDGYPRSLTALKTFHPVADLEVVASAESPQTFADTRAGTGAPLEPKASEPIVWSGLWAADASSAVSITVNGTSFISRAGEGVAEWVPPAAGTYEFRHETEGSDEVLTATFELEAKDISLASVGIYCPPVVYTGGEHKPPVTSATWDGSELVEGVDYTLSYSGNINVGTATVTLEGMGFFGGSYVTNFTVLPRSVTLTSGGDSKAYDGSALVKHEVAVGEDGFAAGEGATFNVTGSQTTVGSSENVFTYMLNEGTKAGNYEITTVNGTLTVTKATYDMSGAKWDYPGAFAYDGTAKSVHVSSLPSGVTAAYTGNTAAAPGTYTAHAEFIYDATNYNKPEIADLVWVIQSAEETKLKETFDGLPAEIEPDGSGGWIVTVTNDIDSADLPIEIPDNVGYVTIDLGGHDLLGGDGRPAIAVVPGEGDGEPTQLTIANSGDDAIVQGGEGSPAIEVDDGAKDGVFVNIGEGVTVQGGDDFTPAIDGEVGTNEGTIVEPVRFHIPGEGAVTVPKTWKTGQEVTWKAKAEKGSVFARWEGAFVDSLNLSENERRDPSLAFIVPAGFDANLISAVFIPIDDDGLSELSFADGEGLPMGNEEGILFELKADVGEFWLVDDSRSYVSATVSGLPPGLKFNAKKMSVTGAPTRSGVYWVQVKAKNASGYQLAVNARMAVSGYTKETAEPNLAKTVYHPLTVVCATEGGTVAGTGVYAEGKKVSVSARPDRGRVFVGWYRDAALEKPMSFAAGDWRTATQSVTVPEVRYLFAKFVTADADKGSIELGVNGAALPSAPAGTPALATNVWAGVALRWRLAADALSSPTVKVEDTRFSLTNSFGAGAATL